ncbi:MAG: hypothetical protein IPH18_07835 [Chitinophagaceae bacterium]|nr:hypothetical protein [Chitinophagaceae bacterium]MBK8953428.1 hypothetical protein [Chitinophagaceae bacterium]
MKKCLLLIMACFLFSLLPAQIDSNIGSLFEDGYSAVEIEKIFTNVSFKNHKKWMKSEGYNYEKNKSSDNYFYYTKNSVVSLAIYHSNEKINQVLFVSSPQKYYRAVDDMRKDKSYRLVEEEIKDNGGGKFVNSAKWVKNGNVYKASTDGYTLTIYADFKGISSKPTIKSFEDRSATTKAVENIQDKLWAIGTVYPKTGSFYSGKEKLIQKIATDNDNGRIKIDKKRMPSNNDCSTTSSFFMHELVYINLADVSATRIYEFKSEKNLPSTFAVCLIVKDWKANGKRYYQFIKADKNNNCMYGETWESGTTVNAYITPYNDTAIALEFSDSKQAIEIKALIDKAIEITAKKL